MDMPKRLLSKEGRRELDLWTRLSRLLLVLAAAAAAYAFYWGATNADAAKNSSSAAAASAAASKRLEQESITTANNHHQQTEGQNATIILLEQELKQQQIQTNLLLQQHSGLLQTVSTQQTSLTAIVAELKEATQAVTVDGAYIVAWQQWAANILTSHCIPANTCPAPPQAP